MSIDLKFWNFKNFKILYVLDSEILKFFFEILRLEHCVWSKNICNLVWITFYEILVNLRQKLSELWPKDRLNLARKIKKNSAKFQRLFAHNSLIFCRRITKISGFKVQTKIHKFLLHMWCSNCKISEKKFQKTRILHVQDFEIFKI